MDDFLGLGGVVQQVQQWMPMVKVVFWIILVVSILVALAVLTHIIKVTFAPLVRVAQWLVWHKPGQELNPVFRGVSHGLRLVIWAVVIATLMYFILSYLGV